MFDQFGLPPDAVRALSRLVWIMGAARGGTTVVGQAIGRHPQHLFTGIISYFLEEIWSQKKRLTAQEIEKRFYVENHALLEDVAAVHGAEMVSRLRAGVSEAAARKDMPALLKFYPLIRMLSGELDGKTLSDIRCWQMKTNNWRGLDLIRSGFPDARFVFVARDPRSVVTSLATRAQKRRGVELENRVRDQEVIEATLYWRTISTVARKFAARHPDRSSILHFESFVEAPERTLNGLFALTAGATLADEAFGPLLKDIGGGATNNPQERYSTLSRAPLSRWQSCLTEDQLAIIERLAGRAARLDGYDLGPAKRGMSLGNIAGRVADRSARARLLAKAVALPVWERLAL